MIQNAAAQTLDAEETLLEMSQSKLDYWLMKNIKIMEELSVEEPSSWMESDTPG